MTDFGICQPEVAAFQSRIGGKSGGEMVSYVQEVRQMTLGKKLLMLRKSRGMSQEQLAETLL